MRLFLILFFIAAAWYGWSQRDEAITIKKAPGPEQIQTLAASVKAHEVVMYGTQECGYCHQAKAWLNQNGFAFTECDLRKEKHCEAEYAAYGANGTPFLVIRRGDKEYLMKNGFDSDEFLRALRT
ncbi:glutaredoxin family protein [Massilia sp. W12]|uniref:glutaredoxin family protein n=1 Tax=Massilia sp. W12 TaxID=3126507 RepID=UPI0030CAFD9B